MRRFTILLSGLTLLACGPAERAAFVHAADQAPEMLSEWGIVSARDGHLVLNAGVTPYELNAPLFSDYALKLRTAWLPAGMAATYDSKREFDFPVGTIISKTFYYKKAVAWATGNPVVVLLDQPQELAPGGKLDLDDYVLVETRLLVRYADGWRGFPYVWKADQSDATLEIAGEFRDIRLIGEEQAQDITYVVPDANQCSGCHTPDHSAGEMRPLGLKSWQLNRSYQWWGDAASQLDHWASHGLLQGLPAALATAPQTAEQQVRAYLDANCAHCHNPVGAADTSALDLSIDAPVGRHYGVCKSPIAVGRGSGNRPYDIYPGRPDDSILVYRMEHSDPEIAMPELGRSAVHAAGVQMVREWIAAMPGEC